MSKKTTRAEKTCLLHGPGQYSDEYKVLKEYSKNYAAQRPHKDKNRALKAKQSVVSLLILEAALRRLKSRNMAVLFPKERSEKNQSKSARVKALSQIQNTVKILMVLTILKLLNLLIIRMTQNDSLGNVG